MLYCPRTVGGLKCVGSDAVSRTLTTGIESPKRLFNLPKEVSAPPYVTCGSKLLKGLACA